MADRLFNVAEMLKDCYHLKLQAKTDQERHYWDCEIYRWKNELMSNNINPDSIDSFEFKVRHGAFDSYPALQAQALKLLSEK